MNNGESFYSQLKSKDIQRFLSSQNSEKQEVARGKVLSQIILEKVKNKKILKDKNLFKKKFNLSLKRKETGHISQQLNQKDSLKSIKFEKKMEIQKLIRKGVNRRVSVKGKGYKFMYLGILMT